MNPKTIQKLSKKKKNQKGSTSNVYLCIPGSSKESCLETNPSERHLKTYHGDFFLYKNSKGITNLFIILLYSISIG